MVMIQSARSVDCGRWVLLLFWKISSVSYCPGGALKISELRNSLISFNLKVFFYRPVSEQPERRRQESRIKVKN